MPYILCFLCLSFIYTPYLQADTDSKPQISFYDKEDGRFDISEYMSQVYGFVPMPILITEPSIGYGGGLALIYLHNNLLGQKSKTGRRVPPSVSGIMFAATENGTKVAGAFHQGYWNEDSIRTGTYIGGPNLYIDMYAQDKPFKFNLQGLFFYQNFKVRINESNFFLGLSYLDMKTKIKISLPSLDQDFSGDVSIASAGLIAEYDSRDNTMSPNTGLLLSAKGLFYDEALGSKYSFESYQSKALIYTQPTPKINLDFNLIADTIVGDQQDIPPYLYPFVSMRGIPIMRYQGEHILNVQSQLSYALDTRWKALFFAGVAKTFGQQIAAPSLSFTQAPNIFAGGLGFRYLIAKKFGLRMGIDVAKSKEDEAFYIQFGTAWKGL